MLRITKYTNIDLSVVGISVEIIKILKEDRLQKYNQILGKVINKKGKQAQINFALALSFLFLMGKIKYYQKEDVIEFLKND
jgi:hypothetical protein